MSEPPWKNRIVDHTIEDPEQMLAAGENFRRHPKAQQDVLSDSLAQIGWLKEVIVNRRTQNCVDGHLRIEQAIREGVKEIPVAWVDLTEEEERLALLSLDATSAMAYPDRDAQDALVARVLEDKAIRDAALLAKVTSMRSQAKDATSGGSAAAGGAGGAGAAGSTTPSKPKRQVLDTRTYLLTPEQAEQVDRALNLADSLGPYIDTGNPNAQGNRLARLAETFITSQGPDDDDDQGGPG